MTLTPARLLSLAAVAALSLASSALAGSHGRPPLAGGLPLDPELLPANSGPGDCVVRRVTGPGGAYRWERIECDSQSGWSGRDSWGHGRHRLDVETRDSRLDCGCDRQGYDDRYAYGGRYAYGDRYGYERQGSAVYDRRVDEHEYGHSRGYDSGYVGGSYLGGGYASGGYAGGQYAGGYVQGGYAQGYGYGGDYGYGRREDRYGPGPSSVDYGYGGAAGRDLDGYLVWPGKLP